MNTGIYKISSKVKPYRVYIGSAKDIKERWQRHLQQLNKNKHNNKKIQHHYNKYGKDDFVFEVLILCQLENLKEREQFFIDNLKPYFNVLKNAYTLLGYKHTKESIEKIKLKNTGRKMTDEQIKKGVVARIGQNTSKGCKRSLESKLHLSKLKKIAVIHNNIKYDSLFELSDFLNVKYQTLYAMITNRNKNRLNLSYAS